MIRSATHDEIVYMAGLFDGEGTIAVYKGSGGYHLSIRVSVIYFPVLELFRDTFGGKIGNAKVYGNRRRQYAWSLSSTNAYKFVSAIQPYAREKKEQIDLAIAYYKEFGSGAGGSGRARHEKKRQEWYYRKFKELKQYEYVSDLSAIEDIDILSHNDYPDEPTQLSLIE